MRIDPRVSVGRYTTIIHYGIHSDDYNINNDSFIVD